MKKISRKIILIITSLIFVFILGSCTKSYKVEQYDTLSQIAESIEQAYIKWGYDTDTLYLAPAKMAGILEQMYNLPTGDGKPIAAITIDEDQIKRIQLAARFEEQGNHDTSDFIRTIYSYTDHKFKTEEQEELMYRGLQYTYISMSSFLSFLKNIDISELQTTYGFSDFQIISDGKYQRIENFQENQFDIYVYDTNDQSLTLTTQDDFDYEKDWLPVYLYGGVISEGNGVFVYADFKIRAIVFIPRK